MRGTPFATPSPTTMRTTLRLVTRLLLALSLLAAAPAAQKIKLATLVPEGSVWDKSLRLYADTCARGTGGRVKFRIYPGGVAGDEPDVMRKVRVGQLQGGLFTMSGLGDVVPALRVFEIPLFFRSEEEVAFVLESLDQELRRRLEEKDLVLLHWSHAGWLRFFSTKPVHTVDELKSLKHFVWAGDHRMAKWYQEGGFRPVQLAATDMMTGLQTGLIEAMPCTGLMANSLQWFRQAEYMLNYPVAPLLGGTVISKKVWDKMRPEDRELLLREGVGTQETLMVEVPRQEASAVDEMARRGLKLTTPTGNMDRWFELSGYFAERMSAELIPADVVREATELLERYRAQEGG